MELSREDCESAVRKALKGAEHRLLDYSIKPASDSPIGFMGTHLRVEAKVLLGGSETKTLKLFAKKPPGTKTHSSFVSTCQFFERESRVYASYAPRMRSVLPPGEKLPLAECYFARGEENGTTDLIILEDLHEKGYRMTDKRKPMDLEHCRVVLDALGRYHASSLLLMRTDGDPDPLYRKGEFESIEESVFMDDLTHPSCLWCKSATETLASAVSLIWPDRFGSDSKREEVFQRAWDAWKEVFRIVRYSEIYTNVLCHGDTWANNIMVMYEKKEDGREVPVDVVLVDHQVHRYAPPALDILLFLHTTTRREFRDAHFDDLLRYYWEAFTRVLTPEVAQSFLPLEQLLATLKKMKMFGIIFSNSLLSAVLLSDEVKEEEMGEEEEKDFIECMVVNRVEDVMRNFRKDPCFKERITEVYQEFLESVGLWNIDG